MNPWGFTCEEMIRNLLPEIGIPHKFSANSSGEWYWWASIFEDRTLGLDCWLALNGYGEVPVDFTVISARNRELLQQKIDGCLKRGVVPVVLEQGMILRAANGSHRALEELGQEIRLQIPLRLKQLTGERMTRERAAQIKAKWRQGVRR